MTVQTEALGAGVLEQEALESAESRTRLADPYLLKRTRARMGNFAQQAYDQALYGLSPFQAEIGTGVLPPEEEAALIQNILRVQRTTAFKAAALNPDLGFDDRIPGVEAEYLLDIIPTERGGVIPVYSQAYSELGETFAEKKARFKTNTDPLAGLDLVVPAFYELGERVAGKVQDIAGEVALRFKSGILKRKGLIVDLTQTAEELEPEAALAGVLPWDQVDSMPLEQISPRLAKALEVVQDTGDKLLRVMLIMGMTANNAGVGGDSIQNLIEGKGGGSKKPFKFPKWLIPAFWFVTQADSCGNSTGTATSQSGNACGEGWHPAVNLQGTVVCEQDRQNTAAAIPSATPVPTSEAVKPTPTDKVVNNGDQDSNISSPLPPGTEIASPSPSPEVAQICRSDNLDCSHLTAADLVPLPESQVIGLTYSDGRQVSGRVPELDWIFDEVQHYAFAMSVRTAFLSGPQTVTMWCEVRLDGGIQQIPITLLTTSSMSRNIYLLPEGVVNIDPEVQYQRRSMSPSDFANFITSGALDGREIVVRLVNERDLRGTTKDADILRYYAILDSLMAGKLTNDNFNWLVQASSFFIPEDVVSE